jgi:pimeloyl-ACP methyl ester carboxylesterase
MTYLKFFFAFILISNLTQAQTGAGESLLNQDVVVSSFGKIRYRAPLPGSVGSPIVLIHGVYGGASHRTFRSLIPLLDQAKKPVYILDLPGTGESDKPRKRYSIEDLDQFVETFLAEVVKDRATVVTESLAGTAGLKVASERPDLIRRLVLLSPTGINSLATPPSQREERLFDRLWNDDTALLAFYDNLLNDNSLRFFLKFAFFNDELVNEELLADYRVIKPNIDQRFISLSFVAGQFYRSFEESSRNIFIPVMGIFGANYENFQETKPSTAADFRAIRPEFEYVEIPDCGSSVQREQPEAVAREILIFEED